MVCTPVIGVLHVSLEKGVKCVLTPYMGVRLHSMQAPNMMVAPATYWVLMGELSGT